jgi:putative restriction endonuclease
MKGYVAVTDRDWYNFLSRRPELFEVNFWQPSARSTFRALEPGYPLLFKLHYPDNFVVGAGFFAHFSRLPVSLAWDAFGEKNGAGSYTEMRRRIEKYRRIESSLRDDYEIGCIILEGTFFLPRQHWIPAPVDFSKSIVRGKGYDLEKAVGKDLWDRLIGAHGLAEHRIAGPGPASVYGGMTSVRQRLGQGAFRVLVTDAYERKCAVAGERALPTLQAAHIRPVSEGGTHRLDNGLLLRSDVHALFDRGYVTVAPDYTFRASRRLKDDFDNGEHYLRLSGSRIRMPASNWEHPAPHELEWHADTIFLG